MSENDPLVDGLRASRRVGAELAAAMTRQPTGTPRAEHEIDPTVREVARESIYTPDQWWNAVHHAWSAGYDHDQIIEICRAARHPANIDPVITVANAYKVPAKVRDARAAMQAQRDFDRQIRAHPLRYALDRLAVAEEDAKIRLGEWVQRVRR